MVRTLVRIAALSTIVALAAAPRVAAACSFEACGGEAWSSITPVIGDVLPTDGVIVLHGGAPGSCLDGLWPHVVVDVRRGAARVAGKIDVVGGTGLLIFRPDAPWVGGERHDVRVRIDNASLGGDELDVVCSSPAVAEFSFMAANEPSPPLEAPPPPSNEAFTITLEDLASLACCPGVTPSDDGTAGCFWELEWPQPGDCAYLHEETFVRLMVDLPEPPSLLRGQVLHQLVVDGALVDRRVEFARLYGSRAAPACAHVESIHLGTGETQRSAEVCTPAEVAATLGIHLRDVAAELHCDAPVVCAADGEWSPSACEPYDLDAPPAAPELPASWRTDTLETECEALTIPGGRRPLRHSCGCASDPTPLSTSAAALLLLVVVGRRRARGR